MLEFLKSYPRIPLLGLCGLTLPMILCTCLMWHYVDITMAAICVPLILCVVCGRIALDYEDWKAKR